MTERPTEQTHQRLTGLGAPPSSAPTLQAEQPEGRLDERTADRSTNGADPSTARAVTQASTAAPISPVAAPQERPLPPPPPADQRAPQPAPRPATKRPARGSRPKRPPRRARLRLTRIDPWSVMKTSFLLSIALGVVTIVSVLMVWSVLGAAGVWESINATVRDIVGDQADTPFTIQNYLGTDRVIGFTMLVAVIDVVLLTAIATLGAFLYNMAAALLGGIDITLVEDER